MGYLVCILGGHRGRVPPSHMVPISGILATGQLAVLAFRVQQIAEILQQKSLISKTTVDLTQSFVKFGFAVLDVCCKISAICCTGFCRIFATGMFQTSSKCYDRAVLLWSRPIVLATTLPNKEGSWVFKVLLQRFCKTL